MASYSSIDRSVSPYRVEVPREYNAAVDLVDRHVEEGRGDRIAFLDDEGSYTYAELADRVNRAGRSLAAMGLRMEERVLLVLEDTIAFPTVFLGAIKAGLVPVPVNTLLTTKDYEYLLRDTRARAVFVSASLHEKIEAVADLPSLEHIVIVGGEHDDLTELLAEGDGRLAPAPTVADDACFWLYTSGSTGQLKGAVHLHQDIVQTAALYAEGVLGLREDDRVFSAAKLFFAYGLGNALTFPLHVGATSILMRERPTPASIRKKMVEERPTVFCGVPTLYASMLAGADSSTQLETGGALRVCTSAGEALPKDVGERFRARSGVDILDGIGSTEMLHIFLSNRPGEVRYGTTGRVVPGYELRLLDESGQEVGPGVVGDLWVSGPSSATQYWNKRELSRATFQGRWTRTGDHYLRDEEGFYTYQGRSDDMLKVGGIYVSPFEVEAALVEHPAVLECAVVGDRDESDLVKPRAFVVLRGGHEASEELAAALKAHVKERLAPYKYPRWIEFTAELPKTATGKIQRFKLRVRG